MDLWKMIEAVITHAPKVLLYGPPGTGKTKAATSYALDGRDCYTITLTEETPMAEIRGHFIPKDKEFFWMHGPAIRAMKEGARLVLNEIDLASGDVLTFLYAVADDPEMASITLPTSEVVQPAEGFQIIATMNGNPGDLPQALRDRFPPAVKVTKPHPDAVKRLPKELRNLAMNGAVDNQERQASVRALLSFADLREPLGDEMAATAVFGPKAPEIISALRIREADDLAAATRTKAANAAAKRRVA